MAWEDPIVNEVRKIRDRLAAEHQYDLRALCRHLQEREEREKREKRKLTTRPPRRPDVKKTAAR